MSNGAPPPIPGSAPAKKGLSPLAWIAIGCGGLVVVGFIVFIALGAFVFKKGKDMVEEATGTSSFEELAKKLEENPAKTAAELAIRVNPELDLVSTDDDAGTITFRNTETGEEATLSFEDIAEGRFTMTTDEGEFSIDASEEEGGGVTFSGPEGETRFGAATDLSDVPDWVPLYPGASETQSAFHTTSGEGTTGALTSKTTDDAKQVVAHYKELFEDEGYKVQTESVTTTPDGALGIISAQRGDGSSLNVMATQGDAETTVAINYNGKKP